MTGDPYSDEREWLNGWHDGQGASWDEIAEVLGESKATWWNIAKGRRDPTLPQRNTIRRRFNAPEITETPAELVSRAGIRHVVSASNQPDTAVLVDVKGQRLERVTLTLEPEAPVTESQPNLGVRRKRKRTDTDRTTINVRIDLKWAFEQFKGDRTWDQFIEDVTEILRCR